MFSLECCSVSMAVKRGEFSFLLAEISLAGNTRPKGFPGCT